MSNPKKYYWLKLKEDFFDDETIRYIEEQPNGILYSNFYLKLCLKSLKYDGRLIRVVGETLIPYDANALSRLTGVDIDTVRCAMQLFQKIGTVKIMETGEIYLSQVEEMVGKETDKAASMRRLRAEKRLLDNKGVTMLPECYPEIETETETEKETETRPADTPAPAVAPVSSKPVKHKYGMYSNVLLTDAELSKLKAEFPDDWAERIDTLSEGIEVKGYKYKSHLATIRAWARRDKRRNEKATTQNNVTPKQGNTRPDRLEVHTFVNCSRCDVYKVNVMEFMEYYDHHGWPENWKAKVKEWDKRARGLTR